MGIGSFNVPRCLSVRRVVFGGFCGLTNQQKWVKDPPTTYKKWGVFRTHLLWRFRGKVPSADLFVCGSRWVLRPEFVSGVCRGKVSSADFFNMSPGDFVQNVVAFSGGKFSRRTCSCVSPRPFKMNAFILKGLMDSGVDASWYLH